jgi:hypothetical protein
VAIKWVTIGDVVVSIETLVSPPGRWRDGNAEPRRSYVKDSTTEIYDIAFVGVT